MNESASTPPPPGNRLALVAVIVALVSLAAVAAGWVLMSREIAALRESQRTLATELASLGGSPLIDIADAASRGPDDAVVTLIEYSDYECPFCIKYTRETMPQIEQTYVSTGRIRYVFKDFPIDQLHPEAIKAHEAGRCAAEQGRFWDMHYRLFSAPGTHTREQLEATAADAGLNPADFAACLDSGRTTGAIKETVDEAVGLGATGTPTFVIGIRDRATNQVRPVRAITGAQPFEAFERAIDAVLRQAQQ